MLTVDLIHPLETVSILGEAQCPLQDTEITDESSDTNETLSHQVSEHINEFRQIFVEAIQAVEASAIALNDSRCRLFTDHKEDVARLAVEIARKVLMQQVLVGAYEIETIVTEALEHVPSCEGVVVYVNPEDLDRCRQAQDATECLLAGVTLAADPMMGRAECRVESPKGVIKSLINEHLEQIGKALLQIEITKDKE